MSETINVKQDTMFFLNKSSIIKIGLGILSLVILLSSYSFFKGKEDVLSGEVVVSDDFQAHKPAVLTDSDLKPESPTINEIDTLTDPVNAHQKIDVATGSTDDTNSAATDSVVDIKQDTEAVVSPKIKPGKPRSVEQYLGYVNDLRSINQGVSQLNQQLLATQFDASVFIEQQEQLDAVRHEATRLKSILVNKDKNQSDIAQQLAENEVKLEMSIDENKKLVESNTSLRKLNRELAEMVGVSKVQGVVTPAIKESIKKTVSNDVFSDWKIQGISSDSVVFVNTITGDVMMRKVNQTFKGVKIMKINTDKKSVQTSEGVLTVKN